MEVLMWLLGIDYNREI